MISKALFIIVAESTVIFGPMFQVGCCKGFGDRDPANCSGVCRRKGPPLAVSTIRRTSSRRPACMA